MTSFQRKAISLAPYAYPDAKNNFFTVYGDFAPAVLNTSTVRMWVQMSRLAPGAPGNNPATDPTPYQDWKDVNGKPIEVRQYVAALDAQIALARSLGKTIVLVFDYYPQWMTGYQGGTPGNDPRYPPPDVSTTSWWASYLYWVAARWSVLNPNNNGAYVNFLEICNEPNLWHDRRADQPTSLPFYNNDFSGQAARMMLTAASVAISSGLTSPIMTGPALADGGSGPRDYQTFTTNVCSYLLGFGFPALAAGTTNFAWSQHNYGDLEGGGPGYTRAQNIRTILTAFGWAGWPSADRLVPYVLMTEGGVRLGSSPNGGSLQSMANRTAAVYNAVHNDTPLVGQGLAMFTNYLDISDPNPAGDCGLRDYNTPFTPRPLFAQWGGLQAP